MSKGFPSMRKGDRENSEKMKASSSSDAQQSGSSNKKIILQFAGLATQFLAGIGISVFIGLKVDQWLQWNLPVWVWVLPLLFIISMIYGIIRKVKS